MKRLKQCIALFAIMLISINIYSQEKLTGTVVSAETNEKLSNAVAYNKTTKKGTSTNEQGLFSINASNGDIIEISLIGYFSKTITVSNDRIVNVELKVNPRQETGVVVTAYGINKMKAAVSSSTQKLNGEEIADTRRENFLNAMAGRVAGATIVSATGMPGASTSIILRGGNSMGGNNQALIVVDGVPYDNQTLFQENILAFSTASRNQDYTNRAADINPEDIESITILKGPEATALYGSDGANGVVMITTKKGKLGKTVITYDNSYRFEKIMKFHEVQTQYGRGRNGISDPLASEAAFGETGVVSPFFFGSEIDQSVTPLYDNIGNFFRGGFTAQHNIGIEGGSDLVNYRLSIGRTSQEGTVPNTGLKRTTVNLNNTLKMSKRLTFNSRLSYANSINEKANKGVGSFYLTLLQFPKFNDVSDYLTPTGSRKLLLGTNPSLEYDNPLWDVNKNRSNDEVNRFTTTGKIDYQIAKGVKYTVLLGLDQYTQKGLQVYHPQSRYGFSLGGYMSTYVQRTKNINFNTYLNLNKRFNKFTTDAIFGFTADEGNTDIDSYSGSRFIEQEFVSINNTEPTTRNALSTINKTRRVRGYSTFNLGYNNIAYLNFAASREGSSTLTSRQINKDPYYNYGSIGGSLVLSEIKGIDKALPFLSFAKIRANIGTTGKSPQSPYIIDDRFVGQLTTGGGYAYGFTGNNFQLESELTKIKEVGIELKFLKNRIGLDVTAYQLNSLKQILAARSSYLTGFILKYFNGGEVRNKGLEVLLNVTPIMKKNFSWDVSVNWAQNRNRILEMPAGLPLFYDSDTWVYGSLRGQFKKDGSIHDLAGGTYRRNSAGQILISPTTGLPLINSTFEKVGDRQQDWFGGVTSRLNYKDFTLSFTLDVRKGGDVFNGTELALYRMGLSTRTLDRNTPKIIDGVLADGFENSATPTKNNIVVTPAYRDAYYSSSTNFSEENFIENVNWVRMRDISISYLMPKKITDRLKVISQVRFFVTATDPFIITNYSGADPSVSANNTSTRGAGGAGIDYGSISTARGINVGFKVKF
jgi:ferric enterobactin receptor